MSTSEAITRTDLKAILDEVLPIERRTLLWTNPSPTASFTAQDVSLGGAYYNYDYLEVEYLLDNSANTDTGMKVLEKTPCHAQTNALAVKWVSDSNGDRWELYHRSRWWVTGGIHFDNCYYNILNSTAATGAWNGNLIPYKIYGIKE